MSPSGAPCAGNCGGRPARAVAGYLEQLRDRCVARPVDGEGERVGGIAKFSVPGLDGGQIKLYRMPG
jgi:hypothetical protein